MALGDRAPSPRISEQGDRTLLSSYSVDHSEIDRQKNKTERIIVSSFSRMGAGKRGSSPGYGADRAGKRKTRGPDLCRAVAVRLLLYLFSILYSLVIPYSNTILQAQRISAYPDLAAGNDAI